jgi:hypothetical protein
MKDTQSSHISNKLGKWSFFRIEFPAVFKDGPESVKKKKV